MLRTLISTECNFPFLLSSFLIFLSMILIHMRFNFKNWKRNSFYRLNLFDLFGCLIFSFRFLGRHVKDTGLVLNLKSAT